MREREIAVENMSAEWGVSRAEIVRRCGAVKTDQELEDERKLRQLEKFERKVQHAGFVKKESHLEKQIAQAERNLDHLSAYEKMRLENMKERQALLEQLDIDQERKEIAEERQKSMIFAPKEEVERRAPSARVKALKERNNKLQDEQKMLESACFYRKQWVSPKWIGQWIPLPITYRPQDSAVKIANKCLEVKVKDLPTKCSVPGGMLKIEEIQEKHRRLHSSKATLESVVAETYEVVDEPTYTTSGNVLAKLKMTSESVVTTSTITSMETYWDFVGFGTADGGVGVHVGSSNISWRPHNAEVTGIAFCGESSDLGILSSSLDGAVRRSYLARQSVLLEYREDDSAIGCMVKRNGSEFLLGCDSTVRLLDLRRRKVTTLLRQGGSRIGVHPTDANLISVGACIFDLRQPKNSLLKLHSTISSLQWSPTSGEHLLAVDKSGWLANVFSMDQLLRGETRVLLSQKIAEPLAAQWNPWAQASLLLSDAKRRTGNLR